MGQSCKHRSACFISLLLKTEISTWHLCDYPGCGSGTHGEGNESPSEAVSAQICARSTDILGGNSPHVVATSRFNAYQALQLYTKTLKSSSPLLQIIKHYFNEILKKYPSLYGNVAQKCRSSRHFAILSPCFTPFLSV